MSVIRAGDIRQLTINGREYDPKEGSTPNIKTGGFKNEYSRNGNGTGHVKQNRDSAGVGDLELSIDDSRQDLEALQAVADDGVPVPVTMTLVSGITYSGPLVLVGEIQKNAAEGSATIELRGERFEQI